MTALSLVRRLGPLFSQKRIYSQGNRSRCLCLPKLESNFFVTISISGAYILIYLSRCFSVCLRNTYCIVSSARRDIISPSEEKREAVRNLH